ncbi:hypothetical protein ACFR97_10180 [Haloplanus litoreus]|uniref:IRF tryptophan pentad repeat domain-containing protein n=1 Tax=Haloplanus litoreus TaxID=767515 RepID=A0ABD5ZT79_9EURY
MRPGEALVPLVEEFDELDGEHFGFVAAKRLLEDEFDVDLTVRQTKQHIRKAGRRVATAERLRQEGDR